MHFFIIKCAQFLFKIGDNINIEDLKKLKRVKLIKKTDLNAFISNVHLTLKIMKFENVFLIKFIHFYVIQNMDV